MLKAPLRWVREQLTQIPLRKRSLMALMLSWRLSEQGTLEKIATKLNIPVVLAESKLFR